MKYLNLNRYHLNCLQLNGRKKHCDSDPACSVFVSRSFCVPILHAVFCEVVCSSSVSTLQSVRHHRIDNVGVISILLDHVGCGFTGLITPCRMAYWALFCVLVGEHRTVADVVAVLVAVAV